MGRASHNLSSGQCVPPFLPIEDQQLHYHCIELATSALLYSISGYWAKKISIPKCRWDDSVMPGRTMLHCILREERNLICQLLPCCSAHDRAEHSRTKPFETVNRLNLSSFNFFSWVFWSELCKTD